MNLQNNKRPLSILESGRRSNLQEARGLAKADAQDHHPAKKAAVEEATDNTGEFRHSYS